MSDITSGSHPSVFAGLGGSLRRNRRRMLLTFVGSSVLFGTIAFVMPPSYKAEASLMVRLGPEYLVNGDPASTGLFPEHPEIVASEAAMIEAPDLALRVIQEVGLTRLYPSLAAEIDPQDPISAHDATEKALLKFESKLIVLPVKDTTLLYLSFKNGNPQVASDVLQAVIGGYLQDRRKFFEYGSGGASTAITVTTDLLARRSAELDAYKVANGITDIDRQTTVLFDQMAALVSQRDQAALDEQGKESEIAALTTLVDGKDSVVLQTSTSPGPGLLAVRDALAKLLLERDRTLVALKPDTPQVLDLQQNVGMAQSLLARYGNDTNIVTTTGRSREYDDLAATLAKAQADAAASGRRFHVADDAIAMVTSQIKKLDLARTGFMQASREVKAAEDAYYQASKRDSEAAAHDRMMEVVKPNVEIVQPARPPFQETWTRVMIAAAGILIGLLGACTFLYLDSVAADWPTRPEIANR